MNYNELMDIEIINKSDLPITIEKVEKLTHGKYGDFLCVNNKVPIQITKISTIFGGNNHIDLFDETRNVLGLIYLCSREEIQFVNSFSEWKFIAYLFEVEKNLFMKEENFKFQYDYLLVNKEYLDDYLDKYYDTAPIWGGIYHIQNSIPEPYTVNHTAITAINGLGYPTEYHRENSIRALMQPHPFERFLKNYHHLELLFDHIIVKQIQSLGDDLKGIGALMKNYNKAEIDRLISVMSEKCDDIDSICNLLNKVDSFKATAEKIFFEYGKENDPLNNNYDLLTKILLETGGFNEENCKKVLGNKANNKAQFEKFIIKLSAYWIYRVRCSIAHNKIGEYILDLSEEDFVAEFAEPLINEIVIQVLKTTP